MSKSDVTGRSAMVEIAQSKEAVLLSHDRESGEDRVVRGTLVVTEHGYALRSGSGDYPMVGSGGDNGWTVLSDDPWLVGLRTPSTDEILAPRDPAPEEYDEWRALFANFVRQ